MKLKNICKQYDQTEISRSELIFSHLPPGKQIVWHLWSHAKKLLQLKEDFASET